MESDGNDTSPVSSGKKKSGKRVSIREIARIEKEKEEAESDESGDEEEEEEEEEDDGEYDEEEEEESAFDGESIEKKMIAEQKKPSSRKVRTYELSEKDRVLYRLSGDKETRFGEGPVKLYGVALLLQRICIDNGIGCIFTVPAQAKVMGVPKRRIHDVVCVFQAIGLMDRASIVPGQVRWLGYQAMQEYIRDKIASFELAKHASDLYAMANRLTTEAVTVFVTSCSINKKLSVDHLPRQVIPAVTEVLLSVACPDETAASLQKSGKSLFRRVYDVIAVLAGVGPALLVPAPPANTLAAATAAAALLEVPRRPPTTRAAMLRQQRDAYNIKMRVERDKKRKEKEHAEERKKRQLEEEERACNGMCGCCAKQRVLRDKGRNRALMKKQKTGKGGSDEESTGSVQHQALLSLPVPPPPLTVTTTFSFPSILGEEDATMHSNNNNNFYPEEVDLFA